MLYSYTEPLQIEHLLSYKKVQMVVKSAHLCRSNPFPLCPRRVTWIQTEREGVYVKSGRSGALKPGKLSFELQSH